MVLCFVLHAAAIILFCEFFVVVQLAIGLIDAEIRKATRTYRPENTSEGEVSTEENKISLCGESMML